MSENTNPFINDDLLKNKIPQEIKNANEELHNFKIKSSFPTDIFIHGASSFSAFLFVEGIKKSNFKNLRIVLADYKKEEVIERFSLNPDKLKKDEKGEILYKEWKSRLSAENKNISIKIIDSSKILEGVKNSKIIINFSQNQDVKNLDYENSSCGNNCSIICSKTLFEFCLNNNLNYFDNSADPLFNFNIYNRNEEIKSKQINVLLSFNFTSMFYDIFYNFLIRKQNLNNKKLLSITDFKNCKMTYETYKSYINIFAKNSEIDKSIKKEILKEIGNKTENFIKLKGSYNVALMGATNQILLFDKNLKKFTEKNFFKVGSVLNLLRFYLVFFPIMFLSKFKIFRNLFLKFYKLFTTNLVTKEDKNVEKYLKEKIEIKFYDENTKDELMVVEGPNPLVFGPILMVSVIEKFLKNDKDNSNLKGILAPSMILGADIEEIVNKLEENYIKIKMNKK